MTKRFKTRLAAWRHRAGLSLREVSDLTGLSESMVSRVERGERQLRPTTKVRLARRLGVSIRDLFEPDGSGDAGA